jgi:hypothetical protein
LPDVLLVVFAADILKSRCVEFELAFC